MFVQSQAGHSDWKTTLEIYIQQSNRSTDPAIRQLLDQFLGDPSRTILGDGPEGDWHSLHAREDVLL